MRTYHSLAGKRRKENRCNATLHGPPQGGGGIDRRGGGRSPQEDLEIQEEYGVKYHRYWYNEESGEVFCLAEAPDKEAAEAVHRAAHGLVADEIIEVEEGS